MRLSSLLAALLIARAQCGTVNFLGKVEQVHPEREIAGPSGPPPPVVPDAPTTAMRYRAAAAADAPSFGIY